MWGKRKKPTAPYCRRLLRGLGVSAQKSTGGRSPVFRSDAFRPRTEQREVLRSEGNYRPSDAFSDRRLSCTDAVEVDTESASDGGERFGEIASQDEQVPRASGKLQNCCIFLRRPCFSRLSNYGWMFLLCICYLLILTVMLQERDMLIAILHMDMPMAQAWLRMYRISRTLITVSRRYRLTWHWACALIYRKEACH